MRTTVLADLRAALPEHDVPAVQECATRLFNALPHQDDLTRNTVMVAYGGGKDSAYAVAFVRAVHLAVAERHGATFRLRVATMRHTGMPAPVMDNIDRTYRALGLHDDPDAELLLIEGDRVRPFARDLPIPWKLVEFNRVDMLMGGHRTYGDGRSTFCNACNLNVANSFGVAAGHDGGVDLIITGDSPREQRDYALWIRRLARDAGVKPADAGRGFQGTLETLNGLARAYFTEIHGTENADRVGERGVTSVIPRELAFFSIYDHTSYASGAHWSLLTDFLGFVFDEIAFNFTESDCANPAIMAHLRGLRTERAYGRTYREGIDQYCEFALDLMRRKDFPQHLIDEIRQRYATEEGVAAMRESAARYAEDAFGLDETQLVCMVYSPFAGGALNLDTYLSGEFPELLPERDRIRAVLAGADDPALAARLERISGLSVTDLRALYDGQVWSPVFDMSKQSGLLARVTVSDPNQRVMTVRHNPGGDQALDRVSGR